MTNVQRFRIACISLCIGFSAATPLFAQAYRGEISFLEDFAIKLYARGDYEQSQREFERIRRMDPDNTRAAEYLKQIEQKTGIKSEDPRTNVQRVDNIMEDLMALRQNLEREEVESGDLVTLIRNLIHENDDLYMALYKRSREVIELRSKFEGTPYLDAYEAIMKTLPPDRVPQRTHQADEMLAALEREQTPPALPSVNVPPAAEVEQLVDDIIARKKILNTALDQANLPKDLKAMPTKKSAEVNASPIMVKAPGKNAGNVNAAASAIVAAPPAVTNAQVNATPITVTPPAPKTADVEASPVYVVPRELQQRLTEKRDSLLDKNTTLMQKKESLEALRDKVTDINASLKTAVNLYLQAIEAIDHYYGSIKAEIAAKNFTEQKQFADLLKDYAAKLKEIEGLKAAIEAKDAALSPIKDKFVTQSKTLTGINLTLADKDRQIASYKDQLAKAKAELDAATEAVNATENTVGNIEGLLQESDHDLADLKAGVSRMKGIVRSQGTTVTKTTVPAGDTQLVQELRSEISSLEVRLKANLDHPTAAAVTINTGDAIAQTALLKDQLKEKDATIEKIKTDFAALTAKNARTEQDLKEASATIVAQHQENDAIRAATGDRAQTLRDIEKRLNEVSQKAEDKTAAVDEQRRAVAALTAQIERLDQESFAIRANLSDKDVELRKVLSQTHTLETELTKAETAAETRKQDLISLKEKYEDQQKELAHARTENETLLQNLAEKSPVAVATAAGTEVASLKQELAARIKETDALKAELATEHGQQENLQEMLKQKQALIIEIDKLRAKGPDVTKLQNYELDRQEKKITDDRLQRLVDEKQKALDDAALETSLLQEKLAALEIKQDAIKSVIQKRDFQLEGLNNTIQSQQKDLALMAQERAELKAKITDNTSATDMAEAKWKASEEEAARLKKEIDGLRATSTNATEALTRQTLDATRAADELTRLKSQLTAKEAEIVTLQKNLDDMRTAPKK